MSINTIYDLGEDAFANLFLVQFDILPPRLEGSPDGDLLKKRLDRITKFNIPEKTIPTSKINFQGNSVDVILGREELIQETSFDLRIDENWAYYEALLSWFNGISQPDENGFIDSIGDFRKGCVLSIKTLNKSLAETGRSWKFYNTYPKKVPSIDLDYNNGDPIVISVTIGFSHFTFGS